MYYYCIININIQYNKTKYILNLKLKYIYININIFIFYILMKLYNSNSMFKKFFFIKNNIYFYFLKF